jgi:hypothetical protein
VAAQKGGSGSEGVGLLSVHVGVDMQDIKKCLLDIRGQLDLGMKRVDWAFHVLEKMQCRGCGESAGDMGLGVGSHRAKQQMDREVVGWSKPKRRHFKKINKSQPGSVGSKPEGLLGPKPAQLTHRPGSEKSKLIPKPIDPIPKPSYEKAQANQFQGNTNKAQVCIQALRSLQQTYQEGESSVMGALRATGVKGTLVAGDASGEHSTCAGEHTLGEGPAMGADLTGEFNAGSGLPEKLAPASGASGSEYAEGLDCGSPSPVIVLSTIPESYDLGEAPLPSVKRSNHMSVGSESADEVGSDNSMPEKQSKQLKVFQRRESPLAKVTKSWVAERVAWNSDHEEVVPGKYLNFSSDPEEQPDCEGADLGDHEELGCLVGMGNQEEEIPDSLGSLSQHNMEIFTEEHADQGIDLVSPASKVLNLAWAVKGTAGLSCGGQEGNLKQVFGHIVADKYGGEISSPIGAEADGNRGMRDEDIPYEA